MPYCAISSDGAGAEAFGDCFRTEGVVVAAVAFLRSICRFGMVPRVLVGAALLLLCADAPAQMVTGADMPGFAEAFGLKPEQKASAYEVQEVACSVPANVLWPGDKAIFTFRFVNKTDERIRAQGRVYVIEYRTSVRPGDVWVPHVQKVADVGAVPVVVDIPPRGVNTVYVTPDLPERYAAWVLVAELDGLGRSFAAAAVRVPAADPGRVQYPAFALDMPWPHELSIETYRLFYRLGVKGCRHGVGYFPTTAPDFDERMQELADQLRHMHEHNITVMLTVGAGSAPQPLGRGRPWLNDDDTLKKGVKEDYVWLPEYDEDFQKWCRIIAGRFGWPKGPVNAMELWNEPWEGVSISGWGADLPRFRELYTRMALGIEQARREDGVDVLIGGACSSTNTRDKLFCDGKDTFLKWLDFVSIHYQPMAADPILEPMWRTRRGKYGPVRVWDTESWVANSEDRVAAVIASMRSQGQERTAGIYDGNVYHMDNKVVNGRPVSVVQAWAPAAAVAAAQKLLGQRRFREILFKNGLPWVFVFEGLPRDQGGRLAANPDDGTVVVVGDLRGVYEGDRLLFRSVYGLSNLKRMADVRKRLESLPPNAAQEQREALQAQLRAAEVMTDGLMTITDAKGEFVLYDFYGNPVRAVGGRIRVPLNGLGYFLRTNGARGSFARLLQAVRSARIEGYEPLDVVVWDMTRRIEQHPTVRVRLTNILNRPVSGTLSVGLRGLKVVPAVQKLSFRPHETKDLSLRVVGGRPAASNTYRFSLTFNAGRDGTAVHSEDLHVNLIARRAIRVDGKLDDWRGVLPQPVSSSEAANASLTEKAWLPFMPVDKGVRSGFASAWLAYDRKGFYFAAKIADSTPYEGSVRFEARDDDAYYYPKVAYEVQDDGTRKPLVWPDGVRRFSYRKDPDLPSGNGTDSVQIAFNVIPMEKDRWYTHPPGTMPRYICYACTDYEFALNQVAPRYGGGTEIWRLLAPGMPRKHFYPRQPRAPRDGGPVKSGKLVMRREGNMRIVEAFLPWSEIPDVKKRLDAGQTIKFSYRVNDNQGPALELAAGRSVSKDNPPAFHNDWTTHWANEVEFAFER